MDTTLILVGSGCLVCLMPLAIYCLYLSHLNGRSPPTFVSGPWDFGALILGLSGFVVLSGPVLLTLVHSTWRGYAYGGWSNLKSVGRAEALAGSLMAIGFLLVLVGVIAYVIRSRRRITAIYNVNTTSVETTLVNVLDDLGYPWKRDRGAIWIGVRKPTDIAAPPSDHESASVRIDSFPSTGHVTLKWGGGWRAVRPEIEALLPRALSPFSGERNAVSGWMFTASLAIMIVMLLWLVVLIYLVMTPPVR